MLHSEFRVQSTFLVGVLTIDIQIIRLSSFFFKFMEVLLFLCSADKVFLQGARLTLPKEGQVPSAYRTRKHEHINSSQSVLVRHSAG